MVWTGAGWILRSRLAAPVGRISIKAAASDERPGKGDGQPEHEGKDGRRKGPLSHSPRMGQVTLPSHHPQRLNRSGPDHEPDRPRRIRLQCCSVLVRGESHLLQVMPDRGMAVRLAPDGAGFDAPLGAIWTTGLELEMGCLFAMFAGLFPRLALFILGSRGRQDRRRLRHLPVAIAPAHLPALRDADVCAALHPWSGLDRVGLVLGRDRRPAGHRPLGRRRQPAQPAPRQADHNRIGAEPEHLPGQPSPASLPGLTSGSRSRRDVPNGPPPPLSGA